MKYTVLTLDDRIRQDLTELFGRKPIYGAQSLSGLMQTYSECCFNRFLESSFK